MRIGDGEFFEIENLCDEAYPILSTRKQRGQLANTTRYSLDWNTKPESADIYDSSLIDSFWESIVYPSASMLVFKNYSGTWTYRIGVSETEYPVTLDQLGMRISGAASGTVFSLIKSDTQYINNIKAMCSKDKFYYITELTFFGNTKDVLVCDNVAYDIGLNRSITDKWIATMGAYLVIMPEKIYFNTANILDFGNIEHEMVVPAAQTSANNVYYSNCDYEGNDYSSENNTLPSASDTAPTSPSNGTYWIDTSAHSKAMTLKVYSTSSSEWVSVPTCYIKIKHKDIAKYFKQGDAVKISGLPSQSTEWYCRDIEGKTSIIQNAYRDDTNDGAGDYIIIIGFKVITGTTGITSKHGITIKREMPDMDFLVECENRLWGCRYKDGEGNVVNEIRACKLGDFKNWECYAGLSTDSYAATCGTDGCFTAAASYQGYPIFFKENCMHRVYGNYPSNFQIQSANVRGVQKGAGDSMASVNGVLYYKSIGGVCVYDGSLPTEITSVFGNVSYNGLDTTGPELRRGAVAAECRNKLFMQVSDGSSWYLFTYNPTTNIWHKEKIDGKIIYMAKSADELYMAVRKTAGGTTTTKLLTNYGSGAPYEATIKWNAVSGVMGLSSPDKKYVSKLIFRLSLEIGSVVNAYIRYDGGEWEKAASMQSTSIKSFSFPIMPKRCEFFSIKLEGTGNMKLYSISKTTEQGSEI